MPSADTRTAHSRLADRYRVLLEIGRTLAGTLSLDELFQKIYRETGRVLEAAGFYISLYNPDDGQATVVFYGDQGEEGRPNITYAGSESEVIRSGQPCMVNDRDSIDSLLVLGEDTDEVTRSAISAPLRHKNRVIGAISAQSYEPESYGHEDLELLQGIADVAAVAIENARQVSELERRRREAEQMEEIGRAITSSLDSHNVIAKVIDAAIETLVQRQELMMIQDLAESDLIPLGLRNVLRAGSGMAVPLMLEGEVLGALSARSREKRAFSEADVRLLSRLASQASVALASARLHSDVQELSLTDPLTGLPNRRQLRVHLERELAAARRGRALALVIFDLDNFQGLNDTLGHMAGDRILERIGLLEPHGVTVSYGIATFNAEMEGPGDPVRAADRDLFQVKGTPADKETAGTDPEAEENGRESL